MNVRRPEPYNGVLLMDGGLDALVGGPDVFADLDAEIAEASTGIDRMLVEMAGGPEADAALDRLLNPPPSTRRRRRRP